MAEPKSPASVENSTTNQAGSAPSLPKFWKGHVTGSNRGTIIIRLEREGGTYRGDAIFHDDLFGVTTFRIEGSLQGNNAKLQMRHFRVNSLSASFTGKADVTFDHGLTRAYGTWDTDIASGTLNVYADRCDSLWSTIRANARWCGERLIACFFLWLPIIYSVALLVILMVDLFKLWPRFSLSVPDLVIALLPAPLLLWRHISRLLLLLGVESIRIGPLQLFAPIAPRVPLTGDIFSSLDRFFVLQTKVLLLWLFEKGQVTLGELIVRAREIGAAVRPTLSALGAAGCVTIDRNRNNVKLTPLGRAYAVYLLRQIGIPRP